MEKTLLKKIETNKLVGRGGAAFSTALKWSSVKKAIGKPKYVICNASEGELGLFKDFYIFQKHPEMVLKGMILAMDFLKTKEGYFNFNKNYYKKLKRKLEPLLKKYSSKGYHFTIYQEEPSYIGGEETALLEAIEGRVAMPRLKPPYPSIQGLFDKPTLIHNVETLYDIALTEEGKYEGKRFYCISGKTRKSGVFHLPANYTIEQIMKETKNWPRRDFFVQIGGSASGIVLRKDQLATHRMMGAGSIEVHSIKESPKKILMTWFEFYKNESCGKCTPCREGSYQLYELLKDSKTIPWKKILQIVEVMDKSSFCALGRSISTPITTYMENILKKKII